MLTRAVLTLLRKTKFSSAHLKTPYLSLARRNDGNVHFGYNIPVSLLSYNRGACGDSASDISIKEVDAKLDNRILKVVWKDGIVSRYPYVFLRENCKCSECFQSSSKQRKVDVLKDAVLNINMKEAEITESGAYLKCLWPNGHQSIYSAAWLHNRRMPEEERKSKVRNVKDIVSEKIVCWNRNQMQDKIPRYDYEAVMNDDKSLFDCLYSLYQHGLTLVDNAPVRMGVWQDVASRIGYLRPTHYGEFFDVKTKADPSNLAYTTHHIPFHLDLPFLHHSPDIQVLHCIEKACDNSGENLFVDGFNVAKKLMDINYLAFEALCRIHVPFQDVGTDAFGEYSVGFSHQTIQLNKHGRIKKIMCNNHVRKDSFSNLTPEETLKFYDAYYQFCELMYQPEYLVKHHLQPGQIVFFHNTRVLHSRTMISPGASRLLQGHYYDWDVIFSKLRVLHAKLSLETPYLYEDTSDFF